MESKSLTELTWLKGESEYCSSIKLSHALAQCSFEGLQPAIGVDPGKNFGIGIVLPTFDGYPTRYMLYAYWGKLPTLDKAHMYFDEVKTFINLWLPKESPVKVAFVEGASYGDRYGQILLEDIRLGFVKAFESLGLTVGLVPPLTARKVVFGNGKIRASDTWLDLNPNAADAGAIALFASGYKYKG